MYNLIEYFAYVTIWERLKIDKFILKGVHKGRPRKFHSYTKDTNISILVKRRIS